MGRERINKVHVPLLDSLILLVEESGRKGDQAAIQTGRFLLIKNLRPKSDRVSNTDWGAEFPIYINECLRGTLQEASPSGKTASY